MVSFKFKENEGERVIDMAIKTGRRLPGKKRILPVLMMVLGLLTLSIPALYGVDKGYKFIRNYSDREYDNQPQNYGMAQGENGILYFANAGGILEYDGVTWRVHYMDGYAMRSLAIDESGTIFVGGDDGDIWRLAPDSNGILKFCSLLEHLDEKHKDFDTVYGTHSIKNKIYFRVEKYLFIWDHKKMITLESEGKLKASFVHNGELIVHEDKRGLLKLVKNKLQPVPGGKFFTGEHATRISVFTPFSDSAGKGTILVGNRKPEYFLYEGGKTTPFPIEMKDLLKQYKPNHGTRLGSGEFALATENGLVIAGPGGELNTVIDGTNGLQADNIRYVFRDKWENIWLCTDIGISKIEYHSPISVVKNTSDLSGITMAVVRHKNQLYAGTTSGLYREGRDSKFRRVPGITFACNSLISDGSHLLAATERGVFQLDNDIPVRITKDNSRVLLKSGHFTGHIWCGTLDGFFVALEKRGGLWKEKFRSEPLKSQIQSIAESDEGDLWLGTSGSTVIRFRFPNGFHQPEIKRFGPEEGLLGNESYVAEAAGHIVVATSKGVFKYDGEKNRFIPDPLLGPDYKGGENSTPVFRITRGWDRQIWFNSESRNFLAVPKGKEPLKIIKQPFRRMPPIQTNAIYPDPERKTVWFAMHDGLYGFDTTVEKNYKQSFTTLIRKVILNEGSKDSLVLLNGNPAKTVNAAALPVPQIAFKNRNIFFEYAAPFFEAEIRTQYKYLLEGYDSDWTNWSKKGRKHYTNLDPGLYRFRVQAKNVYGTRSHVGEYRFRILLPWYRTWWAIVLFLLAFITISYLTNQWWRSVKLEKDKKRLEAEVKERTKEIDEKNRQLERQTLRLQAQSEKLKEMDNVKSRFFTNISHEFRTPLTLILGPLEQIYSAAREQKEKKKIGTILRNSQRLLNLINQLLDLSRLDSGKEKLQAANREIVPFLKGIAANFEAAAEQKKLNLTLQADQEDISFYFDSQKMEKVMNNLLMNAVKYTPPNGSITVSVSRTARERETKEGPREFVNISVKDSGAGIPPDQIDSIFDRFYQAEKLKTKNGEGTGIGLALVKEYVELHHGKVDVHSLEGKGTDFVLRFPTGRDHLGPLQVTGESETGVLTLQPYKEFETTPGIEETGEIENGGDIRTDEAEASQKPVILVVEDNTDVRRYIAEPLESDYSVVEAKNGEEGIEKARALIPDLIVSDIMMPGKDGYELCRTLKKDIKTSHIPTILLTAKASEESVVQGLETGADDYITKPFNTHILLTRIKNLIELRSHLQLKIQKQMLLQPDEIKVSSMDREFIGELKKAIHKHKSDPGFGVEKLSELIYMDRTTLYRKIKALTGETPQLFIRSFRLQIAVQLLKGRAGTVSQVASEVGFDNIAYFAKCFKDKYNILPSTFMVAESGK